MQSFVNTQPSKSIRPSVVASLWQAFCSRFVADAPDWADELDAYLVDMRDFHP